VRAHDRVRLALLVAFFLSGVPGNAAAQWDPFNPPRDPKHVDVSASAGMRLSTDWSDLIVLGSVSPATGAFEQVLARDLVFVPDPVFDAVPLGPAGVGLRLELSDSVHDSPLDIQIAELDTAVDGVAHPNARFVHNFRASAGLVLHFGR
jgi:hypothetical protein